MNATPFVQKPKIELEAEEGEEQEREGPDEEQRMKEQEEALLALVQHRTKEVDHIRQRITYYPSSMRNHACQCPTDAMVMPRIG